MILPPQNIQIELRYLKKLLDNILRYVYIFNLQEPHWCYPTRLVLGQKQSRALTLPKLCVS